MMILVCSSYCFCELACSSPMQAGRWVSIGRKRASLSRVRSLKGIRGLQSPGHAWIKVVPEKHRKHTHSNCLWTSSPTTFSSCSFGCRGPGLVIAWKRAIPISLPLSIPRDTRGCFTWQVALKTAYKREVLLCCYHHSCHTNTYICAFKSHELRIQKPGLREEIKNYPLNLPNYILAIWVTLC